MGTSKLSNSPQSAAERRAAESELRTLIAKFAPEQHKLVAAMRRSLRKRLPSAYEMVYEYRSWFVISYSPSGHGFEGVLAIRGDANGVKLYFNRGKDLPDPEKLLRGSAQARSIDMESASTLTRPAVASLLNEAIARNTVPFSLTSPGPIVIRSASAKKPARSRPATKAVAPDKPARSSKTKSRAVKRAPQKRGSKSG